MQNNPNRFSSMDQSRIVATGQHELKQKISPEELTMDELRHQLMGIIDFGQKCLETSPSPAGSELSMRQREFTTDHKPLQQNSIHSGSTPSIESLVLQVQQLTEQNNQLAQANLVLKQTLAEFKQRPDSGIIFELPSRQSSNERRSEEKDEEIDLLKIQLAGYKEDFESERRDRERAQHRLADVEQELKLAQQQLTEYRRSDPQRLSQSFVAESTQLSPVSLNQSQRGTAPSSSSSSNLVGRGLYQSDGSSEFDEVDSPVGNSASTRSKTLMDEESLHCPICNKEFNIENHGQLLEHIECCFQPLPTRNTVQ